MIHHTGNEESRIRVNLRFDSETQSEHIQEREKIIIETIFSVIGGVNMDKNLQSG